MKTSKIKQTTILLGLLQFIFLCPNSILSQESKEGMYSKQKNYTTFSEKKPNNLPYNAPCVSCEEDISARTAHTKTYIGTGQNKGHIYNQTGYTPIHYQNSSGFWETIDFRLEKIDDRIYAAKDQPSPIQLDLKNGITSIQNIFDTIQFNKNLELIWENNGVYTSLGNADFSNHTAGDDGVYITDIWPGIDMEIQVLPGSVKSNYILKYKPTQESGRFIIRDYYKLSSQLKLNKIGDEIIVKSNIGQEAFTISPCIGYDNKSETRSETELFEYDITNNYIDILIPLSTLRKEGLIYPYTIDPLVSSSNTLAQASITGSMYNSSCNFTNSCNYNLTVSTPPNSTIVDVLFSFTYNASGSCWLQDGAMRIASGGCVSPSTAGYYWFCNQTGGGTCSATDISIYNDILSCLPAPSCTPQNVPFTLQFFRSCWGSNGCSNTCIGAASPWTVTIESRTIEHTNATTPINLSATTVCQGQSLTASTSATYGVPPYTYNWSFDPSGTPSLGNSSSVNITFPTAGTQTVYSTITDACGNQITSSRSVTVTAGATVNATPNPATICSGSSPNITLSSTPAGATLNWTVTQSGVSGGSNGSGNNINQTLSLTGASSGTATYNITGTQGGCPVIPTSVVVNVNPGPTATISGGGAYCAGGTIPSTTITLTGTAPWTVVVNGQTLNINASPYTYTPTAPGTYTISSVTDATCTGTGSGSATITENPLDDASFTYNPSTICMTGTNPTPTLGTPGTPGTFSGSGVTFVNTANGTVDLATTGTGSYTITFTTTGTCPNTSTQNITITDAPDATFSYSGASFCQTAGTNPTPTLGTGATAGTFTATPAGLSVNPTTGEIDLAGSNPGTYTVTNTIAAAGGCAEVTANATVTITEGPTATISGGGAYCAGGTIPSTTITLTGTAPWTVVVNGQTLNINASPYTYTPTAPGTYTISSVTDATCTGTGSGSATITENPLDDASFTYNPSTICMTGTNPTPTLGTPGTPGTFSGSGVTFVNTANGTVDLATTGTGSYTITFTTTGTCPNTSTQNITITDAPDATFSYSGASFCQTAGTNPTPTLGTGATAGTFTATPAGLSVNPTTGEIDLAGSTPGTYTVTNTIAAAGGCAEVTANATVTITEGPTATISGGGAYCAGGTIPSTTITLTGTAPWTVVVNGQTLNINASPYTYTPTAPGTYTISSVTDATCTGTGSGSATITENPLDDASFTYNPSTICMTGTNPTPTLGTPGTPGTFSGSGVTFVNTANGTVDLATTGTGSYTITFTTTGTCPNTSTQNITITDAPDATFSYSGASFCQTAGTNPTPTLGTGATAGTFTATPAGLSVNPTTGEIDLAGSTPGTYTVTNTIAAAGGCAEVTANATVTITEGPTATISGGGAYCAGGTIPSTTITLTGTAPWTVVVNGQTLNINASPYTYTPTAPGTYTISSVTDATCTGTGSGSATITENPLDDASFTYNPSTICMTGTNPTPTLGTPGTPGTFSGTGVTFVNTANGTVDLATTGTGSYTITFTTTGTCPNTSTQNITITDAPDATFSYSGASFCQTAGTNPTPTLGTGATAGTFTATPAGLSVNPTTGEIDLAGSTPGTYTVTNTIAAAGGCAEVTANATVTITEGPTATISGGGAYCAGGTIPSTTITLTGTAPWTVVVNGQTLNINASPYTYTPTAPGTYTISSVTDATCTGTGSGSATITENPLDDASFTYNPSTICMTGTNPTPTLGTPGTPGTFSGSGVTFVNTANGTVDLATTGAGNYTITFTTTGTCPNTSTQNITIENAPQSNFTYTSTMYCKSSPNPSPQLGTGATNGTYSASPAGLSINSTTGVIDLANSNAGTYTITNTVAGTSTCAQSTSTFTITINNDPIVDAGQDINQCSNSPITLSGSGASTYIWDNGVVNGQPFTPTIGTTVYTVVGTDNNGCTGTDQVTVTISAGPSIDDLNIQDITCFGLNNGSATVVVSGGTPPYSYDWSQIGGTGSSVNNLSAGNYTLTVTDASDCSITESFTITQPLQIEVTETITDFECGVSTGEISVSVTGGSGPYTYNWIPNVSSTNTATNLQGGNYSLTVTDANGCSVSSQYEVEDIPHDLIDFTTTFVSVGPGESVVLDPIIDPDLVYDNITWVPPTGLSCTNCLNPVASPSTNTYYYVTITTPDGCTDTDSIEVRIEIPCGDVFIPTHFSPNGDGTNDYFCVRGNCITMVDVTIYNRWGEVIFASTDQDECWNGTYKDKPALTGVYVYKISIMEDNGNYQEFTGNLHLIR